MVMTLKGKKLYPNDIQEIRGFTMTYKGLVIFTVAYKELAKKIKLKYLGTEGKIAIEINSIPQPINDATHILRNKPSTKNQVFS
jgi:hypothetical protein